MNQHAHQFGVAIISILFTGLVHAFGQTSAVRTDRITTVRGLHDQLRWNDESSHNRYLATRDDVTRRLWNEIDAFVTQSFRPTETTENQVNAALSALLGPTPPMAGSTTAFFVMVPVKGRFLIVGIDLSRGGSAIAEDAISFRAYQDAGNHFTFVSSIDDLQSSDSSTPFLASLSTKILTASPIAGESWFLAAAEVPPRAPPIVAIHLYSFDANTFRTLWAPKDVVAEGADEAIELTTDGFIVNRLFDPSGQAAISPSIVIHEQYTVTSSGPYKVMEWRTDLQ
jgi:hypothetical protein